MEIVCVFEEYFVNPQALTNRERHARRTCRIPHHQYDLNGRPLGSILRHPHIDLDNSFNEPGRRPDVENLRVHSPHLYDHVPVYNSLEPSGLSGN